MSITAVPLRPIAKGSMTKLWVGIAAAVLVAGGLAYAGTSEIAASSPAGFLAKNGREDGVVTTASGLQYKVLEEGKGPSPTASDVVLIGYVGQLLDGKIFDQNEQAPLEVAGVVPGFSEGLQVMKVGGKYRLWLPPELGYGANVPEGGPIPANAVLVFDVNLIDFKSKEEIARMQAEAQAQQGAQGVPGGGAIPGMPTPGQ